MRVKVQKITYTIPEIKCTYYNPKTRRFVMVFMDGTEKSSYVHPEDELNIVTGFALCLAKAVMGNKQNLRETAQKVYRDPARKHKRVVVPIEDTPVVETKPVTEQTVTEQTVTTFEETVPTVEEVVNKEPEPISNIFGDTTEYTISNGGDTNVVKITATDTVEETVEEALEENVDKNQMSIDDFKEELDSGFQETTVPSEENNVQQEEIVEPLTEEVAEPLTEDVKEEPSPSANLFQEEVVNEDKTCVDVEAIKEELEEEIAEPLTEEPTAEESEEVVVETITPEEVVEEEGKLYLYRVSFTKNGNESYIEYNTLEEANNYANWLKNTLGVDSTVVQIELTE